MRVFLYYIELTKKKGDTSKGISYSIIITLTNVLLIHQPLVHKALCGLKFYNIDTRMGQF